MRIQIDFFSFLFFWGGGAGVSDFLYYESKLKIIKNGGRGAKVSDYTPGIRSIPWGYNVFVFSVCVCGCVCACVCVC